MKYLDVQMDYCLILLSTGDYIIHFLSRLRVVEKTTLLPGSDTTKISEGNEFIKGMSVGVVDERSEIAGCYRGVAQNHLGIRTDVLDGCPKAEGMIMLIRSMRPEVIAVDEIGGSEDVHAIEYAMHCGCRMLATAHADSMEELQKKPVFDRLIRAKKI